MYRQNLEIISNQYIYILIVVVQIALSSSAVNLQKKKKVKILEHRCDTCLKHYDVQVRCVYRGRKKNYFIIRLEF